MCSKISSYLGTYIVHSFETVVNEMKKGRVNPVSKNIL